MRNDCRNHTRKNIRKPQNFGQEGIEIYGPDMESNLLEKTKVDLI